MDTPPAPAAPFTSVLDCVRATLRTSGARGPFQGLSATLLRNAPANAVYLGRWVLHCNTLHCIALPLHRNQLRLCRPVRVSQHG